jgi:hypothetical protein
MLQQTKNSGAKARNILEANAQQGTLTHCKTNKQKNKGFHLTAFL